jgi:hypothetical protein
MHKVLLAVRIAQRGEVLCYLSHDLTLPFVPFPGLRFEQGISCRLWETPTGKELDPEVERVIYDLDEEQFVCLFTVDLPLSATFWQADAEFKPGYVSSLEQHFRHMPIPM